MVSVSGVRPDVSAVVALVQRDEFARQTRVTVNTCGHEALV